MPRNVRNFWISAKIDGRSAKLEGGPAAKDGEMSLTLYQRVDGGVRRVLDIECRADRNGVLRTIVAPVLGGAFVSKGGTALEAGHVVELYSDGGEIVIRSHRDAEGKGDAK